MNKEFGNKAYKKSEDIHQDYQAIHALREERRERLKGVILYRKGHKKGLMEESIQAV
ncbi:MAG TPA: hypothetical protein VLF68_04085 [Candidatus Saccharimonadales bacterium]|nr:hypothetical protein [Candidatus Saccharimonadales bacterium]